MYRHTDRQTYRQTDIQTDRHTDRLLHCEPGLLEVILVNGAGVTCACLTAWV